MTTINACNYTSPAPIDVPNGGTGAATMTTAYGVICAGTTATGVLQNAGAGTAGQVLISNGAGALPSFQNISSVLQVVQSQFTATASSSSITMADTGITATITPSSTSSKILIISMVSCGNDEAANTSVFLNIIRNSTILLKGDSSGSRSTVTSVISSNSNSQICCPIIYLDSPSTVSSITYKVQFAASNNTGTVYINRSVNGNADVAASGRPASNIILMEIL